MHLTGLWGGWMDGKGLLGTIQPWLPKQKPRAGGKQHLPPPWDAGEARWGRPVVMCPPSHHVQSQVKKGEIREH